MRCTRSLNKSFSIHSLTHRVFLPWSLSTAVKRYLQQTLKDLVHKLTLTISLDRFFIICHLFVFKQIFLILAFLPSFSNNTDLTIIRLFSAFVYIHSNPVRVITQYANIVLLIIKLMLDIRYFSWYVSELWYHRFLSLYYETSAVCLHLLQYWGLIFEKS